jgi:hypothetical protein
MFVNHAVEIAVAFDDGCARLLRLLDERTIDRLSRTAYEHGWELLLRVGPAAGISKLVRARFFAPQHSQHTLSIPLRWEATGATGPLFPALDADLILEPVDEHRSTLTLLGSYHAPGGPGGDLLDAAIMTRVAHASIAELLNDIAHHLTDTQTPAVVRATAPSGTVTPTNAPGSGVHLHIGSANGSVPPFD